MPGRDVAGGHKKSHTRDAASGKGNCPIAVTSRKFELVWRVKRQTGKRKRQVNIQVRLFKLPANDLACYLVIKKITSL